MSSYTYVYIKLLLLNKLKLSSGMVKKENTVSNYSIQLQTQMLHLCMGLKNAPK